MKHKDTEIIQENVFGLNHPLDILCRIWTYSIGHKSMSIRCEDYKQKLSWMIHFTMVEYFSGATIWKGANFRLHSQSECIKLLTRIQPSTQEVISMLDESDMMDDFPWRLYSIPTNEGNIIRILAAEGHLVVES